MKAKMKTHYIVECYDEFGVKKWTEDFCNLVVTEGLNCLLNSTFNNNANAAWYVGLKDGTGAITADDVLDLHTWGEFSNYTGNRPAFTPSAAAAAGSISNTTSKAIFNISGIGGTIYGCFLATVDTGTAGILYGVGDFVTPRTVALGDIVNVTITISVS